MASTGAERSRTRLTVLVVRDDQPPAEGGLPALLASGGNIDVVRITYLTPDSAPQQLDAMSILQRGAKRMSIVLWHRTLQGAGLDSIRFRVAEEHTMEHTAAGWRELT